MTRTMKKIIMIAAVSIMAAIGAKAQTYDTKHEIAISYGFLSNSQIIDAFEEITLAMFDHELDNDKYFGPISAEYFYHAKPWLGVGGIMVFGHNKQDVLSDGGNRMIGKSKNTYYTLLPAVKFDYLRRSHFGMYSKLGFGATMRNEKYESYSDTNGSDDTEFHVNWQASLLGIEAGSTTLRGFLEAGTGEQGIFVFGLRCKF